MDRSSIGNRLRQLVDDKKISRKELEKELNVHYDTIMKWFRGISIPSHEKLVDLSRILNSSIDYILTGTSSYQHHDLQDQKIEIILEQSNLYKEKAEFFEMKYRDLEMELDDMQLQCQEYEQKISETRRAGDPPNLNVVEMRHPLERACKCFSSKKSKSKKSKSKESKSKELISPGNTSTFEG